MKKILLILLSTICITNFNFFIYAAENSEVSVSPINQEFINYLNTLNLYSNENKTGYIPEPYELPYIEKNKNYDLPSTYNIITNYNTQASKEFISPIKNQGQDGVCWAFSAIGVLESALLKQNNLTELDTYDFSENHMRYALSSEGNNKLGFERKHDGGGNFSMALAYLTRSKINGPVLEENDKYNYGQPIRDVSITNSIEPEDYYVTKAIRLANLPNDYTNEQKQNRINEIKQLILDYGCVTMSYYSDKDYYDDYYNPANYYYTGTSTNTNHAVAIVGWDDNYSKTNFKNSFQNLPQNDGAFLIKNSWGKKGKFEGYFYMSYEDKFAVSKINTIASVESRDFYDNIYEYDPFGNCSGSTGFNKSITNAYVNIFESKSKNELLTAVSTNIVVPNCYFKFFISKDGNLENLEEVEIQNYQKESKGYQIEYTGYEVFKLNSPIEITNDKFAIAIEIYNENFEETPYTIPRERNIDGYLSEATQNAGESFIAKSISNLKSNSNVYDLAERYNANACIKAFTIEKSYNVNIASNIVGGTIEANMSTAKAGTDIIVTVKADKGMQLKDNSLIYNDGTENHNIDNYTFKMPECDVTVFAEFEKTLPKSMLIQITTTTKDAQIFYTLDNTNPTEQSAKYTDKINIPFGEIQDTFTIKAMAKKDGFDNSDIAVKTVPINSRNLYNKEEETQKLKLAIEYAQSILKKAENNEASVDELINALSSISSAIINYSKVSTPIITVEFVY